MELNPQGTKALNLLRDKIVSNNTKWIKEATTDEKIGLQTIYQAITKKTLSLNCNSCWYSAVNIINNFIKYYETTPDSKVIETKVVFVEKITPYDPVDTYTVKQLRSLLKEREIFIPHNSNRATLIELLNG